MKINLILLVGLTLLLTGCTQSEIISNKNVNELTPNVNQNTEQSPVALNQNEATANTNQSMPDDWVTFQGKFDNNIIGFENPGLFSFEHPKDWSADFNRFDNESFQRSGIFSMHFGPRNSLEDRIGDLSIQNLGAKGGQGGYLNLTVDDYIKQRNISINDLDGQVIATDSGYVAYLRDGNRVISFSISDAKNEYSEIFKQIVASFKFYFNGSAPDFKY